MKDDIKAYNEYRTAVDNHLEENDGSLEWLHEHERMMARLDRLEHKYHDAIDGWLGGLKC